MKGRERKDWVWREIALTSGSFCGEHARIEFSRFKRERKRRRGGKKWGSFSQPRNLRLFPSSRHFHPSTSVPLVFRFGAETMKSLSPLAIASKANAPPVYIRPPLFPHFSIRPFYFVSTAVHPKWYQRFFPPLRFRPFFAPLSPFLSLSLSSYSFVIYLLSTDSSFFFETILRSSST